MHGNEFRMQIDLMRLEQSVLREHLRMEEIITGKCIILIFFQGLGSTISKWNYDFDQSFL